MSSSFFGFTIGLRALSVNQQALEVISHNIANINTPGHSRQEAVIKTTDPQYLPSLNRSIHPGQVGTGVEIEQIRRIRDQYADMQLRHELQNLGKWRDSTDILQQIGMIFSEPGDNGLGSILNNYWNAWSALEASPEDMAKRQNLIDTSRVLSGFFNTIDARISQLRADLNSDIKNRIAEINSYSSQITELNRIIKDAAISGDTANDLMDRRDLLIDKLSGIINIDVRQSSFGEVDIFTGSKALVRGEACCPIDAALNPATGVHDILWSDDHLPVDLRNGQIYALQKFRDSYLPGITIKMNEFVSTFISCTNEVHSAGFGLEGTSTGNVFFTGAGMKDIGINPDLEADLGLIAAGKIQDQPGDNTNIQQILLLRNELLLEGTSLSFDDYYNNMIVSIGMDGQQCLRERENTQLLLQKIESRKESVSGVSLDEELVNMVKFQHAYNAAAKVITTMDELFETIINTLR